MPEITLRRRRFPVRLRSVASFFLILVPLVVAFWPQGTVRADPQEFKALLIGLSSHKDFPPLPCLRRDVRKLQQILEACGSYRVESILDSVRQDEDSLVPLSDADWLRLKIENWLEKLSDGDTGLLYVAGYFRPSAEDESQLVLPDWTPQKPCDQAIAVSWLFKEVGRSQARFLLVILDVYDLPTTSRESAHGTQDHNWPSGLLQRFAEIKRPAALLVLQGSQPASSQDTTGRGSAANGLILGLSGLADVNQNQIVELAELTEFLHRKPGVSGERLCPSQPVVVSSAIKPGDRSIPLVHLRPRPLRELLDSLALSLAFQLEALGWTTGTLRVDEGKLEDHLLQALAVNAGVEETDSEPRRDLVRVRYRPLLRYCAQQVATSLISQCSFPLQILEADGHGEMVAETNNRDAPGPAHADQASHHEMDGSLQVQLTDQKDHAVVIACDVVGRSGRRLASAQGVAQLRDAELAMIGLSGAVDRPALPGDMPGNHPGDSLRASFSERSGDGGLQLAERDFLQSEACPLRVSILVKTPQGWENRPLRFDGLSHRVALRPGETYAIQLATRYDTTVFAAVLVDGLNTLPERVRDGARGVTVEKVAKYQAARPVHLGQARCWVLPPPVNPAEWRTFLVRGFVTDAEGLRQIRPFQVVEAPESEAAREGAIEALGLITIAFYRGISSRENTRGETGEASPLLGTSLGPTHFQELSLYRGPLRPGPLLAVVNIIYGR